MDTNKYKSFNANVLVNLEIEKSKLSREKSIILLDKALMLYFLFLFVGIMGFINGYIKASVLNALVLMSFGVLVVGIIPYWITMKKEEKKLESLILEFARAKASEVESMFNGGVSGGFSGVSGVSVPKVPKVRPRGRGKRGVSPLIATVLLIAFAVALGAVVMNWGRTYTENTVANVEKKSDVDVKCSLDVQMKLLELSDKPQMCVGEWGTNSYINFTAINVGTKKIDGLRVTVIGDGNPGLVSNTSISNSSMVIGGAVKLSIPYAVSSVGSLKKVLVIPVVDINGIQTPCSGSGSTLERDGSDITACNSS
ncbi:hypothetical protein HY640_00550 [Candidatus Woesearchaeota archaeon]|nr:hypothetical protein [Candidatus Woesearchaeota archaeon]